MDVITIMAIQLWIGSSLWVWLDARALGVKRGEIDPPFDMSPAGWFWSCIVCWSIVFPGYLAKRPQYKAIHHRDDVGGPTT